MPCLPPPVPVAVPVSETSPATLLMLTLESWVPNVAPVPFKVIFPVPAVPVELIDDEANNPIPIPTGDVPVQDTAPSTVVILVELVREIPVPVPELLAVPFIVIAAAPAPTPVDAIVAPNVAIPDELDDVPMPIPVMLISPVTDEMLDGEFI